MCPVNVGTSWNDFSAAAAVAGVTSPSLPPFLAPSSSRLASVSYTLLLPALVEADMPTCGTGGVPMPSCRILYRVESMSDIDLNSDHVAFLSQPSLKQ